MGLTISYSFGGVQVNTNPLAQPRNRSLKCENWIPQDSGVLRLRDGYSQVAMTSPTSAVIHSMCDYRNSSGTRYIVYIHGTTVKRLALATGTITTLGSLSSSSRCEFTKADGKLLFVNGTDQKVYDGTTLRDIGIRAATTTETAVCRVNEAIDAPTTSQAAITITKTTPGGNFGATSYKGYQLYMHYFATTNVVGHGPGVAVGSRQVITSASTKFDLSVLPDLSGIDTTWKKIFSITADGDSIAKFNVTSSASITNMSFDSATRIMTVTAAAHGFSNGDIIEIAVAGWEGVFAIAVTNVNVFTYTEHLHPSDTTLPVTGTAYKLFTVANATTTGSITLTTVGSLQANTDVGVKYSDFSTSEPIDAGYNLYACLYNPTTQHIGNRVKIQGRVNPLSAFASRGIFILELLPSPTAIDSEYRWLIGRTGDHADVPWIITDTAGNFKYTDYTRFILRDGYVVGNIELPVTNDKPTAFIDIEKCGDRVYAIKANSRKVYFCPAPNPDFAGMEEQSFFEDDYDNFPVGEDTVAIAEYNQDCVTFSENWCAVLQDLGGRFSWDGPWNVGIAGLRAYTNTPYGPYWLSSDKQLYTISDGGPICVSEQYEEFLLKKIDAAYLSTTEVVYQNDPDRKINCVKIKGRDSSGNPFMVIHDFRLRDEQSPYGQGYLASYSGQLATDFTVKQVRDNDGELRVFAGGANGQIYQLDSTGTDDASTFDATYLALVSFSEGRVAIPEFQFVGDSKITVSGAKNLNSTELAELKVSNVPDGVFDFKFRVSQTNQAVKSPEYLQMSLTSHASDASNTTEPMTLSTVPHFPVENYGRVYAVAVEIAE